MVRYVPAAGHAHNACLFALWFCFLVGAADAHARSAPSRPTELLPPEVTWVDRSALECTRAHLSDLQATTERTRARVAQACTALLVDTQTFVVRHAAMTPAKRKVKRHRSRRAMVTTESPVELTTPVPDELSADDVRTRVGKHAVASLHTYLSARPEAACTKVVLRYSLDSRCEPRVDVNVRDAVDSDVERDVTRLLTRAVDDARADLDCTGMAGTLDGQVSLIPVASGPAISMLARR